MTDLLCWDWDCEVMALSMGMNYDFGRWMHDVERAYYGWVLGMALLFTTNEMHGFGIAMGHRQGDFV